MYSLEIEPVLSDLKTKRIFEKVTNIEKKYNSQILELEENYSRLLATMQFNCCIQDAEKDYLQLKGDPAIELPKQRLSSITDIYNDMQFKDIDLYKEKCCRIQNLLCDQQQERMQLMRGSPDEVKAKSAYVKKRSKNVVYSIGAALQRNGYKKIQVVALARIALVKFQDPIHFIDIDLTLNGKLALYNSDLIKAYLSADSTGKLKKVALLVKALTKAHGMCDASTGKLSSYCWVILLLHTLMIHNFLPGFSPISGKYDGYSHTNQQNFCDGFFVRYSVPHKLPEYYQRRLASVTIGELLILFTSYLTTRVNVEESVLTLRGRGEIIKKNNCWERIPGIGNSSNDFDWRLSVEVMRHDMYAFFRSSICNLNSIMKAFA